MKEIQPKEVWFVKFPFEEDKTRYTQRPGIVLSINDEEACILTVKVTSKLSRENYKFDIGLFEWEQANLDRPSVARISKMQYIEKEKFDKKIGTITNRDWKNIQTTVKRFFEYIQKLDRT